RRPRASSRARSRPSSATTSSRSRRSPRPRSRRRRRPRRRSGPCWPRRVSSRRWTSSSRTSARSGRTRPTAAPASSPPTARTLRSPRRPRPSLPAPSRRRRPPSRAPRPPSRARRLDVGRVTRPEIAEALGRLDELTRRLRRECPWDREQDERTIVPHTLEEAYELADAAQRGDDAKLLDELGDVLFQVHFLSLLLEERGA